MNQLLGAKKKDIERKRRTKEIITVMKIEPELSSIENDFIYKQQVSEFAEMLTETEEFIMRSLYEDKKVVDIAKTMGVTVQRIYQIQKQIRRKYDVATERIEVAC